MTSTIDTTEASKAQEFVNLIQQGVEAWMRAGEVLVELLDEDRDAGLRICEDYPDIKPDMILLFERIGRKQLCPKLLLCDTPGTRRLMTLPLSVQEKYVDEPVELLVVNGEDTDKLNVPVKNLTSSQAAQVFGAHGPRSLAEQRTYIVDKQSKASFPRLATLEPYTIKRGSIIFHANCKLTLRELENLLMRARKGQN